MKARVISVGQAAAGDDGVGAAVVRELRTRLMPSEVEFLHLADPTALVALLGSPVPIILVDAVLGVPTGQVVALNPAELAASQSFRMSSHGLGITEAIELARVLGGGADLPAIHIVAITIARPERYQHGLSPDVAAAVPCAAERVLSLLEVNDA